MNVMEVEVHGMPLIVEYNIWPGHRGARGRFGEPLEPSEPASIDIVKVETLNGIDDITDMLSERVNRMIEEKIMEGLADE